MAKKTIKKRKIKKFNEKTRIVSAIRRIWFYSPHRRAAVKSAKEGNFYRCSKCRKLTDTYNIDHIESVVAPEIGWAGYDSFIQRMFVEADTGLRALCTPCHTAITEKQNIIRKETRIRNKL